MSNIDKRALREAAVRAGGVKWQYMRATQHSKAYITDDKGSTVINCTDGDVPAKCAGFLESANPAAVLALLDELEAADNRIAEMQALASGVKQFSEFQICHYGATEDYAKGYIDCQNNYNKVLFAAAGKGEAS
ncbi:TPA: ead/Ea22-like family protein [Enterobacter hormaechei]